MVDVLREGTAARGEIVDMQQNFSVRINGRYPWMIRYRFQANGQEVIGRLSVLDQPGTRIQAGKPVCILYLPDAPGWNTIYPHP